MVSFEESELAIIFQKLASYKQLTDHFGMNDEQAKHPNAAGWMIDCIKQYQTASQIAKSMKMFQTDNMKVENYAKNIPLPEGNPLLGKTKEGV